MSTIQDVEKRKLVPSFRKQNLAKENDKSIVIATTWHKQ
jgi:hypothetical protein